MVRRQQPPRWEFPSGRLSVYSWTRSSSTSGRGGSCVVDPYGHYVTQPVWDKEDIIYADLDMQQAIASRMEFDGVGHYARPDVLELRVHE